MEYGLPIEGYEQQPVEQQFALPVDMPTKQGNVEVRPVVEAKPEIKMIEVDHDPWMDTAFSKGSKAANKLFGTGGEERYQTWPEKVVTEGLTAAGDIAKPNPYPEGSEEWHFYESERQKGMVPAAMAISSLAGSGGLGGTGEGAGMALGSGPSLRPALKYKDKLYKGKEGQQHQDVIPKELVPEFERMAMSGEDISHYNFGFVNDKGQFLTREKALEYGINSGIIDPHAGQYGALTSTLMADSSKPGTAIEAMAKTQAPAFYSAVEHNLAAIPQAKMSGDQWLATLSNKPGVKPEELQWTGLSEFLESNKGKPVTKEQINEHLANNKVELKEVSKGSANLDKTSPYYNKELERVLNNDSRGTFDDMHLSLSNDAVAYASLMKKHPELKIDDDWATTVLNSVVKGGGDTKYHSYQLPGGENYREMLMTLPDRDINIKYMKDTQLASELHTTEDVGFAKEYNSNFRETFKGLSDAEILKIADKARKTETVDPYKSSHWDEPNILAHVRMNDRFFPDVEANSASKTNLNKYQNELKDKYGVEITPNEYGKLSKSEYTNLQTLIKDTDVSKGKKSLHLEEIQSDWHQQGRDRGYKAKEKIDTTELNNAVDSFRMKMSQAREDSWKKYSNGKATNYREARDLLPDEAAIIKTEVEKHQLHDPEFKKLENASIEASRALEDANRKNNAGVPDAPFKKSWHELALKRMLREAAEKGYDRLSWTPGEAQAARYDLSSQVRKLKAIPIMDQHGLKYEIKGWKPTGDTFDSPSFSKVATADELPNIVGKEMAKKIIAESEGKKPVIYEGLDLKVGGEGMKGFYDQIIPKALEKIGKDHGVKVKQTEIGPKYTMEEIDVRDGRKLYDVKKDGKLYSSFATKQEAEKILEANKSEKGQTLSYIDIPQSLKDHAMHRGFPLFSKGIPLPLMPIEHDPFKFKPVDGNPYDQSDKKNN